MDFKTWYKCKFKGYVVLRELKDSNDDDECRVIETDRLILKSDLPKLARKCRGEPYCWSLNRIVDKIDGHDIDGYSGSNAWAWLHTDAFDNILSGIWKEGDHINLKKILIVLGVVVAIVIGAYIVFGGRS